MRMHVKNTPKIHLTYLCNQEVYFICKTCCIICGLFSTKCRLFRNFIFFCSNNMLFIKSVLKFKYEPGRLKVNAIYGNKFIHKAICGQNAGV